MKIVNRSTFLSLPRGTLFCKVSASGQQELRIKLNTCGADFIYRDLIEIDAESSEVLFDMFFDVSEGRRSELPLDWHVDMSRDGLFDQDQLFAVLDHQEATALIVMLTAARNSAI